jgi:polysaccharide pyruvyl transferase WcaK-like protein
MPKESWDGEVAGLVRALETLGPQAVLLAKDSWCQPLEEVARRTGSVFFGPKHAFAELWPLLAGASFLVTGHFHYAIMGAMVGCPFVPLSVNNHKMHGVCEHLNWHLTDPFDATSLATCRSKIVSEAKRLLDERSEMSARLSLRSVEMRTEVRRLGSRIVEALLPAHKQNHQSGSA